MPYEFDNDESPWDDAPSCISATTAHADVEWTKLSSGFQNAGYRDGITTGKESALQEGFDAGFAQAGSPRGRELGLLRGLASALHLHFSRARVQTQEQMQQQEESARTAREIADALATVRFADIAPPAPPDEAEHTHRDDAGCNSEYGKREQEQEQEQKKEEEEEGGEREGGDGGGSAGSPQLRTMEDVRALRVRLEMLLHQAGLQVDLNLE